jgi:hypothetical protein
VQYVAAFLGFDNRSEQAKSVKNTDARPSHALAGPLGNTFGDPTDEA